MTRWEVIGDFVEKHGWTRGAELGVYEGATLFYLLDRFPKLHMIGVDQWQVIHAGIPQNRETGEASYAGKPMDDIALRVAHRAEVYGQRCRIMYMSTDEAHRVLADGILDFVFIDADHTTEAVRADIRNWSPKVRSGGWIMGHDINWPSVKRAVLAELPFYHSHAAHVWSYVKP